MVVKQKTPCPQPATPTISELRTACKPHLDINQARLTCFLMLVLAVIKARTVSLAELCLHIESRAMSSSVLRRFERFFASGTLRSTIVGRLVLALLPTPDDGWVLAMDRTNWKQGKRHINLLVVTVSLGAVGVPIASIKLPSIYQERQLAPFSSPQSDGAGVGQSRT